MTEQIEQIEQLTDGNTTRAAETFASFTTRFVIEGFMGRQFRENQTKTGAPVMNFSVGVVKPDGAKEWFDCAMFGRQKMYQYFVPGRSLKIAGYVKFQTRQDAVGNAVQQQTLVVERIALSRGESAAAATATA